VVVLIDEYDTPILDNIDNKKVAIKEIKLKIGGSKIDMKFSIEKIDGFS
jgi:hypothetical protein